MMRNVPGGKGSPPVTVGSGLLLVIGLVIALVILSAALGSWYTVDQGEIVVVTRNGRVTGVSEPGFHGKLPIIDDVTTINLREQRTDFNHMLIYTADQQPADTAWSVTWRAERAAARMIYEQFQTVDNLSDRILGSRFPDRAKAVFGQYTASKVVSERSALVAATMTAMQEASAQTGLVVTGVQLLNVDYSDAYEQSVEQRMQAEVEVAKLKENAAREEIQARIAVIQANARAESLRAEAEAEAFATKARGDAEAASIRARGEALRDNPNLVGLITAERWNGALPTTMVPGSTLPFVQVK